MRRLRAGTGGMPAPGRKCSRSIPRAPEPLLGVVGEEEQRDVAGNLVAVHPGREEHAAVDLPRVCLSQKAAFEIGQKLTDPYLADPLDGHAESTAVIE